MIANAQIADDAVFDCQVLKTATSDHLRSNPAQVTVYCKYKITLQNSRSLSTVQNHALKTPTLYLL